MPAAPMLRTRSGLPTMARARRRPVWTAPLFFLGFLDASHGLFFSPATNSPNERLLEVKPSQGSSFGRRNDGSACRKRSHQSPRRVILKAMSGNPVDTEQSEQDIDDTVIDTTAVPDPQPAEDATTSDDGAWEVMGLKIPQSPEEIALAVDKARETWKELDATIKATSTAFIFLATALVGGQLLGDSALGPLSDPGIQLSLPCVFLLGAPELSLSAGAKITAETKRIVNRLASADDVGLFGSTSSGSDAMLLGEATNGAERSDVIVSEERASPETPEAKKMQQELSDLSMKINAVEDLINEANATSREIKRTEETDGSSTILGYTDADETDRKPLGVTSEKNLTRTPRVVSPATLAVGDADMDSPSESAMISASKKAVNAPRQAERAVVRIPTSRLQASVAKSKTSTRTEAEVKSVSNFTKEAATIPAQSEEIDLPIDNKIVSTSQPQASVAQTQLRTKIKAEPNSPPNSAAVDAKKATTTPMRPAITNNSVPSPPPQTSLANPKGATKTKEAKSSPESESNVAKKAVTASGQSTKADPAMGSTRIPTPSLQASATQPKATSKTEEEANSVYKSSSSGAKKGVITPTQSRKVATESNIITTPPMQTSVAQPKAIPSFLKPTGVSAPVPKVKDDNVLARREKLVFDYNVASAAFAAVAVSTVGLSGGYVAPALLSASGPALASGVAWILGDAARNDRLDSDTYKRLNLSLAAFGVLSLLTGILSMSSYSARDRVFSGAFLASLLALSPSTKGWAYGVGGFDSRKKVAVLPELVKGTLRSVKGLVSVPNFKSLGYLTTTVFAGLTQILTLFEIANLLQAEADCRAVVLRLARLARFTLLTAVSFTLKDAADRGRLGGNTFIRLNFLSAFVFGSIAASAYKSLGGLVGPAARAFSCSAFCLYSGVASILAKRKQNRS